MSRPTRKVSVLQVEWVDSCTTYGWQLPDDKETYSSIISVGLLAVETKDAIVLTTSLSPKSGRVIDQIAIPKCCIKSCKTIKTITK